LEKSVLSFDLTGTLATFRFCDSVWFEGLPTLYAEKNSITFVEAKEHLRKNYDELGDHATEWYDIKYWFARFGLGTGWIKLLQEFSSRIEFYPETLEVLERCSRMYDLVLITNASREFVEIETAPIKRYFRNIISCVSDFGEVKKTPEFYAKVCHSLGEDPAGWIHVGDHWQFDFLAPRGIGITSFYLDRRRARVGEFIIHDLNELERKLL
jgi:HAD superfamily hydrolase (TIGR01549 family)